MQEMKTYITKGTAYSYRSDDNSYRDHETITDSHCLLVTVHHRPGSCPYLSKRRRRLWEIVATGARNAAQYDAKHDQSMELGKRSKRLYNLQWQANPTRIWTSMVLSQPDHQPPIVTNSTALNGIYQDLWVLAEFTGRPVMTVNASAGPLS